MSLKDEIDEVTTATDLKEEFQAFKVADLRRREEIREVITAIEERVNILRRSRGHTWEAISDRATTELDRVSATLSERVADVERAMQTQSATPATTLEPNPTIHEDIARLGSKIEAGFRAFSLDVDELREEMSQAIDGQEKDLREWARDKIAKLNAQPSGLREFVTAFEQFIHKRFPSQESRASAPSHSPSQGCAAHASSSTAASSSAARAPTPTHDYGPSERATPVID